MRLYDPKDKGWTIPLEEQVKIIEANIRDAKRFLSSANKYLADIKKKKNSEPYCYINKYFRYEMEDGKTLFFKVLRVHGLGIVAETKPVYYSIGDETAGTSFFYDGKINLEMVRNSKEISFEEYDKYVTYAFETGW